MIPPDDVPIVATYLGAGALYVAYHYGLSASVWRRMVASDEAAILARRVSGGALLGLGSSALLAATGADLATSGLGLGDVRRALAQAAIGAAVLVPALYVLARAGRLGPEYPEIRRAPLAYGALAWTAYLIGYEALFRGLLVFPPAHRFGPWPALAIQTALYAYAHLPKHAGETAATLAIGLIFGWMALETGTILTPLLVHIAVAVSAESFTRRFPPPPSRA